MKLEELEQTMEPIFAMYRSQRVTADEAFGTFCHRIGIETIEEFMDSYTPGSYKEMVDPFAPRLLPERDGSVGIDSQLLATVEYEARARGYDSSTLVDIILREALGLEEEE